MSSSTYLSLLFDIARWPILFLLLVVLTVQALSFRRAKPKYYDTSALVFLTMIGLCLGSKTVIVFLKAHNQQDSEKEIKFPLLDVVNMITDLSYWVLLNFFILEMKTVKDIVSAKDNKEFENNFKVTVLLRKYVLSVLAAAGLIFRVGISVRLFGWEPLSSGGLQGYNIIQIVARTTDLII